VHVIVVVGVIEETKKTKKKKRYLYAAHYDAKSAALSTNKMYSYRLWTDQSVG